MFHRQRLVLLNHLTPAHWPSCHTFFDLILIIWSLLFFSCTIDHYLLIISLIIYKYTVLYFPYLLHLLPCQNDPHTHFLSMLEKAINWKQTESSKSSWHVRPMPAGLVSCHQVGKKKHDRTLSVPRTQNRKARPPTDYFFQKPHERKQWHKKTSTIPKYPKLSQTQTQSSHVSSMKFPPTPGSGFSLGVPAVWLAQASHLPTLETGPLSDSITI